MVSYYLPQVFCICDNPHDIVIIPEYPVIPTAGKGQHIIICYVWREYLDIQRPGELVTEAVQGQIAKVCLDRVYHCPTLNIGLILFVTKLIV